MNAFFLAFQFAQSRINRPAFEVNFRRNFEPEHIFSPFCDGFDVQQVFRADVFAGGVSAPRTAADRQGRFQFEVEQIADRALRRGRVDQNAPRVDLVAERFDAVFLAFVGVQHGRVAGAAVIDQRVGLFHRVFKVFGAVQSQNR